jgi:FAD dependent oxidoreductase TIGR03364
VIDADMCVVGAGIVGLAHALEARARGLTVTLLERDACAAGASVRNFGHVFVSAMADGPPLECALVARERWLDLGERAGAAPIGCGTLVVARDEDELAVMATLAGDPRRGARVLTAAEAGRLAPIPTGGLCGALYGGLDLRLDPRRAVAALAALLERDEGATLQWRAHVHGIEPGRVHSSRATVRAELVVVCPGPHYDWLAPELAPPRERLTRCKLQMLRVRAPASRRYDPALMTGLSLLRYPGFGAQPGIDDVRARLAAQCPEHVDAGLHLIVTQLPGGDLVLSDTHEYGDTVSPFGSERLDELVLAEAKRLLGVRTLEIVERWHGVYPWAPGDPFEVWRPFDGLAVVEIVAGMGMTTALGLAPRTLDLLLDRVSARCSPPAAPPPSEAAPAGCGS